MKLTRNSIQNILFFGIFLVFFILVARLLYPFFTVILWSSILYIMLNPLYARLSGEKRVIEGGKTPLFVRRSAAAALLSIGSVLVILVPLGVLGILLAGQSAGMLTDILEFLENAPNWINLNVPPELLSLLTEFSGGRFDTSTLNIRHLLAIWIRDNQETVVSLSTKAVRNIGSFGISLAFTIFTLYFFLMDGRYLKGLFVRAIPIKSEYMTILLEKFRETSRRLVRGNLLVALIQGLLAFILFTLFRIKGSLLLGVLVSICSFIPLVGSAIVWLPVSVHYIIERSPVVGTILMILSALLISILDNFYRPLLVGGPIKIHPLPVFFAIVGGVSLFGINGLIIGPLIIVLFFSVLDLFRELYRIPEEENGDRTK